MDVASEAELEEAREQLTRLLSELSKTRLKENQLEAKVVGMAENDRKAQQLRGTLERVERDQRRASALVLQALRDVRVPVDAAAGFFSHHLPLALKQLIAFYLDCTNTRNMLDSALTELALSRGADAQQTSSEKLLVLLTELRALRLDAARLRLSLDEALTELEQRPNQAHSQTHVAVPVKGAAHIHSLSTAERCTERVDLHTCMQSVMVAARKLLERERKLKETIKKQQTSLNHAFHRCKEVEMELAQSRGSAAEQRESLVTSALYALQQLRHHLGAVHAVRPEATKSLDEALQVRQLLPLPPEFAQPQLHPCNHSGHASGMLSGVGVSGMGALPPPGSPSGIPVRRAATNVTTNVTTNGSSMMEQFQRGILQRVVNESANLLVSETMPSEWPVRDAVPYPHPKHERYSERLNTSPSGSPGFHRESSMEPRPMSALRPPSRAGGMLRVPQPGSKASLGGTGSSYAELPTASLLASYATVKSHLQAARSMSNF